jgi:hypothetical protein
MPNIPLKILIIDPIDSSAEMLTQALKSLRRDVLSFERVSSLVDAQTLLTTMDINVIYIDLISLGLDAASKFIFDTRKNYSSIVFVMYLDFAFAEGMRSDFYSGSRKKFIHYYKLNKLTPAASFNEELKATVEDAQSLLKVYLTKDKINKLQEELLAAQSGASEESVHISIKILQDIQEQLNDLKANNLQRTVAVKPKSVFLSYRFAESDYIEGLQTLLKRDGFHIITGQNANTFISQAILERIKSCEYFVCLMTRADEKRDGTFTTSPWLLEEKGAALAMDKRIVLMVEDGVNDIGGLQGDWQRINFTARSFTTAAIRAVDQLKSYSGIKSIEATEQVN